MRIHRFQLFVFFGVMFQWGVAGAEIARDPIGVNVSAARPMSLTVRFASTDGTQFTTDQALFCFRQLANGACDPAAILGRLPKSRDRASTSVPTTRITDVMTIPYSVIRSTLAIAQQVDFSDFFYIRRFVPVPGGDLGAGVNQPVYQKVTCHLAGPARVPLSLTRVALFARESHKDDAVKLIRINEDNLDDGRVYATVEHTGTGTIEGWWEVRRPGEPAIREFDLLPEAALEPADRGRQRRYHRLRRFRGKATTAGYVLIEGPSYAELPRDITGRHDLLLRFEAGRGRENRARLNVAGEPLNVFSGAVAGFRIPVLEYHVPVDLASQSASNELLGRLTQTTNDDGEPVWMLAWRAPARDGLVLRFKVNEEVKAMAPASDGYLQIDAEWLDAGDAPVLEADLIGSDGKPFLSPQRIRTEDEVGDNSGNQEPVKKPAQLHSIELLK
jgi:hypothetical protein